MAYRSFESGLADAKGTLNEIGIAFVGKRKETAMALHAADEKSHIPFHRFFLLRTEREIHTTVTSDVRNTSRHLFPKAHGSCKLCLVNEREVAVSCHKEKALSGFIIHGASHRVPELCLLERQSDGAHFFIDMHGDSETAGLVFVKLDPDLLSFSDILYHLREGQKNASLRPHVDECAETGRQKYRCIANAADGDLRQAHTGRQTVMRVVVKEDLDPLPFLHLVGLLPFVKEDISNPCQPVRFREDNGWLVRFYYYRNRISLEVFHALSDGAGALIFFRTLLAEYLRQTGISVPAGNGVLDLEEPPRKEELEDAYARYAGRHALGLRRMPKAYANTGTPEPFYTFHVTMGFVSLEKLRETARSYDASITEYLSAALIHVLLEKQRREHPHKERPVALAVPINLRSWFPSETVRNFITTVRPSIDPALGDYTFPEIVSQVRHYMKLHVHRQELQAAFTGNVRFTKNFFLRAVPVFLKNPVMAWNYRTKGVRPYSATFTNPGPFPVPPEMAPHISHMEVVLGQAAVPRPHVSSISYGNTMEITFAGTQKDTDTEREFFRFLVRQGLPVRIESNRT